MSLNSVNTNRSAMITLQNLNVTGIELATTQVHISAGGKVDSAKDNGEVLIGNQQDAFLAENLGDSVFATKAVLHIPYLILRREMPLRRAPDTLAGPFAGCQL